MRDYEFDGHKWIPVFETGTAYQADMVRGRILSHGIRAVILSKTDSSFPGMFATGDTGRIMVLVADEDVAEARRLIVSRVSDAELEKAALEADPATEGPELPDDPVDSELDESSFDPDPLSPPPESLT